MESKEKRHQIEDREFRNKDQKEAIALKSSNKCVWCGKKVYIGYPDATIDHFIPLKKGGTNEFVNLVLMCKDCNQKKGSYVVPINIAARHLNEPHQTELGDYFEDYVSKYDYISRGNLMCCDMYELDVMPEDYANVLSRNNRKGKKTKEIYSRSVYNLKRAYPDDLDRLTDYFAKYLAKYDLLSSKEAARENIKFWMRFGAIYYVEIKDEIYSFGAVLVNKNGFVLYNIFSYYSTKLAQTLANGIVNCLSYAITTENNLPSLSICLSILAKDSLARKIHRTLPLLDAMGFANAGYLYKNTSFKGNYQEGIERLQQFKDRFYDVESKINTYLSKVTDFDLTWMSYQILKLDLDWPTGTPLK